MAVKRTRFLGIRVTDGEHQQLLERCNGRQLAVDAGNLSRYAPGAVVAAAVHRSGLAAPACRDGNNLNQIARKINGGQWSGADRVQVVAALMAIDAELERLRHAVLEKGADDDR